jgi:hypothetical protein
MSILRRWNNFFFQANFSVFEILCFMIIGELAGQYSLWWYLALIPTIFISIFMQNTFGEKHG